MATDDRQKLGQRGVLGILLDMFLGVYEDGSAWVGLLVRGTTTSAPTTGATAAAVASGTTDVQAVAAAAGLRLVGWTARSDASGGLTSKTVVRAGTTTGGTPLAFINLNDDQSSEQWYGPEGKAADAGIFIDRDGTNAVAITIFYRVA